jgi:Flp pilus assembly protein TadD
VWDLAADDRPLEDLLLLAHLLSGRQVDAGGDTVAFPAVQARDAWRSLRPRYPADFTATAALAAQWDRVEARACAAAENWRGAIMHLDRLLAAEADADLHAQRGQAYAEMGRWDRAAADYAQASQLRPEEMDLATRHALLCLGARDQDGYRKACAALLKRFGSTRDPNTANSLAWICVFSPEEAVSKADLSVPVGLARQAVASNRKSHPHLNTLGSILFRAGQFNEAIGTIQEAVRVQGQGGTAWDHLILAMAEHHLGRPKEARQWLEKAVRWMDPVTKGRGWVERLELQILRREAEALINGPPP